MRHDEITWENMTDAQLSAGRHLRREYMMTADQALNAVAEAARLGITTERGILAAAAGLPARMPDGSTWR